MFAYIVRRLGLAVLTVLGVIIVTFVVGYLLPANPARAILGAHASAQAVANLDRQLGLNLPVWDQFWIYFKRLAVGNLGVSYYFDMSENALLWPHAAKTAALAVAAVLAELVVGLPVGVLSAVKRGTIWDRMIMVVSLVGYSVPVFWLGVLLLYEFGQVHPVLPLGTFDGYFNVKYYILPAFTIGLTGASVYARLLRTSLIELANQDFVRTARAKGMTETAVLLRHMLPNALIPFVTQLGLDLGTFMGGLIIVEQVFAWPGLGYLTVQSIANLDIPTILAVATFAAIAIVVVNIIVDLTYALLDPRITYS
jgi:ABC-type dipeptide/oligopeptide/nickel transport system permease component